MTGQIRILLVDDDDLVRDILGRTLRDRGYEVDAVATTGAAVSHIGASRYSLVVTDAKLLDGAGVAIADRAKSLGIPAVILTGYAPETRPGGPQHNYLFKPIRAEQLASAVEKYVGVPRPQ